MAHVLAFPTFDLVGAGHIHQNMVYFGENWFWLFPVTSAGMGWTLYPCVQFKPKLVKYFYLIPWILYLYRPCDSTSVFKPCLAVVSRLTLPSAFTPAVILTASRLPAEVCNRGTEIAGFFGTKSQLRLEARASGLLQLKPCIYSTWAGEFFMCIFKKHVSGASTPARQHAKGLILLMQC